MFKIISGIILKAITTKISRSSCFKDLLISSQLCPLNSIIGIPKVLPLILTGDDLNFNPLPDFLSTLVTIETI